MKRTHLAYLPKKLLCALQKKRVRDEEEASFVTCKIFHLDIMKLSKMPYLVKLKKKKTFKGPFKYIITPRGGEGFLGRCKKGVRKKWGEGGV